jgi:hypothetical protein
MSPTYRAHPEFGLFCISRGFRRKILGGLVFATLAVLAGALVLRLTPQDAGAAISAPVNDPPPRVESVPAAVPLPPARAESPAPREGIKTACEGDTWTYLDGKCVTGRGRKPSNVLAATDGAAIAAIPLGRSAPPALPSAPSKPERAADTPAEPVVLTSAPKDGKKALPPRDSDRDAVLVDHDTPLPAALPTPPKPERTVDAPASGQAAAEPTVTSTSASKENRKASRGGSHGREVERMNSRLRDGRGRDEQRSARGRGAPEARDRQMSAPKSAMRFAKQLSECLGGARCAAGEQIMRAFMPSGMPSGM